MDLDLAISLQPKQYRLKNAILDRRPDAPTVLGFGGSRGAAKSGAVRRIALILASERPGIIVWIIRRVWDDLNKDHVMPLFEEYPELRQFYRAGNKELRLPHDDGKASSIFFIHAGDTGRAKRKSRGPQAHYIFLEQAEEFSQEEMQQLAGSNRAAGVEPGFCKRIYTFNPGGIGTNYLRRIFHLKEYRDNENPGDFMFIQGYGWDNYEWFRALGTVTEHDFYHSPEWNDGRPFTDKTSGAVVRDSSERRFQAFINETDFGRKLNALPPQQRIGELMGSFEQFAGQYFADVWEESSIVLPVDIVQRIVKPWSRRWMGLDWGFSHFSAVCWFASVMLSPEEVSDYFGVTVAAPVPIIVLYREFVVQRTTEPDLAALICQRTPQSERPEIRYCFIGHDAFAQRGSANTVADQLDVVFAQNGLPRLDKADIERVHGWRLMYSAFDSARRLRNTHATFSERGGNVPAFFISAACPEIIQAIPTLVSAYDAITRPNLDPMDVLKLNGQSSDDVADACRYGLVSYITAEPGIPPENERAEIIQQYLNQRPSGPVVGADGGITLRNGQKLLPQQHLGADENMTRLMNRMREMEAKQQDGMYLRRRIRGR